MADIRTDRLLVLAEFLDKLPVEKFNFAIIADQHGKPMMEALAAGKTRCGTTACAIGWLPAVFPNEFEWKQVGSRVDVLCVERDNRTDFSAAEEFFNILPYQAEWLFIPGASPLEDDATPQQVAEHIRGFVAEMQR